MSKKPVEEHYDILYQDQLPTGVKPREFEVTQAHS